MSNNSHLEYKLQGIRDNNHVVFSWDDKDFGDDEACELADALMQNTVVREIHLAGCNVGPRGAKALAEALKLTPTIKVLNLPENEIGDEGAIALAEAIRQLPDLSTLICDTNRYTHVAERAIANAIVLGGLKNITRAPVDHDVLKAFCSENFKRARGAFQPFPLPDVLEPERLRDMAERWPAIERSYANTATLEVVEALIADMPRPDVTQADAVAALMVRQGNYRAIDNPLVWRELDATMATLNNAGLQLQAAELLTADGKPSELLERAIGCGRVRHLFSYDNWEGASKADLQSVLRVLPEDIFIPNRTQLLSTIGREERQNARN